MRAELPGVILAAGDSSRFGSENKLLMSLQGRPVISHTTKALLDSELSHVLIITGYEADKVREALSALVNSSRLTFAHNPDWLTGRASSMRVGVESLPPGAPAALFMPGDLPLMTPALTNRLIAAFARTGRLAFMVNDGKKGHPVIFPRELWLPLTRLQGDESALALVKRHWEEAEKVPLEPDEEVTQWDLDTQAEYEKIRILLEQRSEA